MLCKWPFDSLFVDSTNFATCCPIWLNQKYVIFKKDYPDLVDPWKIWNHQIFQDLRKKLLNANFSACHNCPRYKISELDDNLDSDNKIIMERGPKRLVMSDEFICNLQCWTCRKHKITKEAPSSIVNIRNNILQEFLPTAKLFSFLHSGEALVSQYYRNMILNYDWDSTDIDIELFSNCTLISRYWDRMENFRSRLKCILLSIDAGTEEYYKKIRGGNFQNVVRAMELFQQNNIELWTNMTITSENFKDITNFIQLSKKFGATKIELKKFYKWWQSDEEWKEKAIHLEDHPQHSEFAAIIKDIPKDINISHLL